MASERVIPTPAQIAELVRELRDPNDTSLRFKELAADWLEALDGDRAKSNPPNGLVERLRAVASKANSTVIRRKDGRGTPAPRVFYECAELALEAADALALYQQQGVLSSQRGDDVAEAVALVAAAKTTLAAFSVRSAKKPTSSHANSAIWKLGRAIEILNSPPIAPASQRGENRSANASLRPTLHGADTDTQSHLDNVQRRFGAPIYWQRGSVIHLCGGAMVHPGTFLLWPICGKGDVPAGQGFKSTDAKVDCPGCLAALPASPATPIGGLSLGVEGDQGSAVPDVPARG